MVIVLLVAACFWTGGWFSLILIARSTTATVGAAERVEFFRHFGRVYGIASTIALLVAFASGLALLLALPWTALSTWLVLASLVLTLALGAGVVQARRLSRLRRQLVAQPSDGQLAARITSGARWAIVLRASLGVISVVILVLAVLRTR